MHSLKNKVKQFGSYQWLGHRHKVTRYVFTLLILAMISVTVVRQTANPVWYFLLATGLIYIGMTINGAGPKFKYGRATRHWTILGLFGLFSLARYHSWWNPEAQVAIAPYIVGIAYVCLLLFVRLGEIKEHLSLLELFPGLSSMDFLAETRRTLLGAILQELFYRGTMIGLLKDVHTVPWVAVLISASLFSLEHYMGEMSPRQISFQFLLSLGLAALYYFSGSISACIVAHLMYNGPSLYALIVLYTRGIRQARASNQFSV